MKKLIVGLLVAFLMATGLAAISSVSAAAPRCPYTGCVKTVISASAKQVGPRRVRVSYSIRTLGNATPRGTARVILKGGSRDTFRAQNRPYPGANSVRFFRLPQGTYQVRVKFIPARNSAFGRSFITTVVDVE